MSCTVKDISIVRGKTFIFVVRWASETYVYKPITAITKAAPAVITAATHGVTDGWPIAVVSVQGMTEINAEYNPPRESEYVRADVTDSNTIALNTVNSAGFTAYASGGYVQYREPMSLAGCTARMQVRQNEASATVLADLDSADEIDLDDAAKTITITIPAATTALYTFENAVYELEVTTVAGVVYRVLSGNITTEAEVTR